VRLSGNARSNFDCPAVTKYTGFISLGIFNCCSLNLIMLLPPFSFIFHYSIRFSGGFSSKQSEAAK